VDTDLSIVGQPRPAWLLRWMVHATSSQSAKSAEFGQPQRQRRWHHRSCCLIRARVRTTMRWELPRWFRETRWQLQIKAFDPSLPFGFPILNMRRIVGILVRIIVTEVSYFGHTSGLKEDPRQSLRKGRIRPGPWFWSSLLKKGSLVDEASLRHKLTPPRGTAGTVAYSTGRRVVLVARFVRGTLLVTGKRTCQATRRSAKGTASSGCRTCGSDGYRIGDGAVPGGERTWTSTSIGHGRAAMDDRRQLGRIAVSRRDLLVIE
jgi:hypothetical protein